jgi:hydroxypyruvate isomerase
MLFTELPLRQRFAAAAGAGFDAVELHYPYELTPSELTELLRTNALRLVLFNSSRGTPADHGLACVPEQGARFLESIEVAGRYASAAGCPAVHVLLGRVDPGQDSRVAYRLAAARLAQAADLLAAVGVKATVEALNAHDVPGYLVDTTGEALRLIRDAGAPNLFLQFDVYHARMAGEDVLGLLDAVGGTIGHVQIADVPGRHEPGTGRIDFELLLTHLDASGYRHWVGCEYRPLGGTAEGLKWARPWLRSVREPGGADR